MGMVSEWGKEENLGAARRWGLEMFVKCSCGYLLFLLKKFVVPTVSNT